MLNLTISTIVFFVAAWFLNNYLDAQGIPKGMTRGVIVVVLATLMAWGVGWTVDWAQNKIEGPQAVAQAPGGLTELQKAAGQDQP
jgi:hypothetical protein